LQHYFKANYDQQMLSLSEGIDFLKQETTQLGAQAAGVEQDLEKIRAKSG
jgi:hypothetical protein